MKAIIYLSIFCVFWSINYETIRVDKRKNNFSNVVDKNNFDGIWINENEERPGITKCKIRYDNNRFVVQMWSSCVPSDCDWGENTSKEVKKEAEMFELLWDQEFAESLVTYEIIEGKLKLVNNRHYKDNSGRSDRTHVEYFIKQ